MSGRSGATGPSVIAGWSASAAPPPKLTVSQWAEEKRLLPETSGARGARWRNAAAPYLAGIMDAAIEPTAKVIALMKGAQVGGSEALSNIIGYHIEYDPCAMLVVQPTVEVAEEWSKERLSDLIRNTPALAEAVREKRAPRAAREAHDEDGSTLKMKMFTGGYLALGGANTPNTFARRSVRLAFGDDVDRFPPVVGEEGDPADLLVNRTNTFYDGRAFFVSTPTMKGGRIDTLYQNSDQRRYFMPCLGCQHEDYLTWSDRAHFFIEWDERDPETARVVCPACGAVHYEPDRRQMIALGPAVEPAGQGWRPTALPVDAGLIGFHLPATLSLLGVITLPYLVEQWLSARQKGKESLRVFVNTKLAEGWEDRGARKDPQALVSRRASYGDGVEVPGWAACLTAGVDVQADRFELSVYAWGMAEERALVDHRAIPGDPKHAETRDQLLEALGRRYTHASGHLLPIHATCLDTGYATEEMYDFVLAHQVRRIYATKGFAGKSGEPIVGKPSERRHGKRVRPVRLYPVNVDDAKANVMSALSQEGNPETAPGESRGPSYVHFPAIDTVHEEFFAQLCAEHKETRYNRGGVATHFVWVQDRERNEALDCAVLALAAYRLLNPNIRQMLDVINTTPAPVRTHADESVLPAAAGTPTGTPKPPQRRFSRSNYLSRR